MKPVRVISRSRIALALFAATISQCANGDGGIVLLHEAHGPFSVTVFVAPELIRSGLTDVSVLVQSRTNGEVVLDAAVSLAVEPPRGVATAGADPVCGALSSPGVFPDTGQQHQTTTIPATRQQASNKLLYAAALPLNATGDWRLHIDVSRGSDCIKFDCLIPVSQTALDQRALWPYLLIPPIAIAAFALNQKLRWHSLEQGQNSQPTPLRWA
jgi:hypothetical protein